MALLCPIPRSSGACGHCPVMLMPAPEAAPIAVLDRALRALPVTQHDRIWPIYLDFIRKHDVPETAEEKLQRVIFERVFMIEKYAERWPEAVLKAVRKGGPGYAKRMAGRRMEIAESIAEFAFSREYDDEAEDNNGDSFSSRNSDNSTRTRISGNTGKVLKRADVAAIAGLLSLGETLVTIDFSRDREMTKEKLRQSIKAFVDARRQAQTVKDYAEAWTVVDAIVTNGVNSLDRLVDVVSSRKNRNFDDDFSKKLKASPQDALRMASKLFEKKQEFVSKLFKGKKKDDDENNNNENNK